MLSKILGLPGSVSCLSLAVSLAAAGAPLAPLKVEVRSAESVPVPGTYVAIVAEDEPFERPLREEVLPAGRSLLEVSVPPGRYRVAAGAPGVVDEEGRPVSGASVGDAVCLSAGKPVLQQPASVNPGAWSGNVVLSSRGDQFLGSCEYASAHGDRSCQGRFFDPKGKLLGSAVPLFTGQRVCRGEPSAAFLAGDGSVAVAWSCGSADDPNAGRVWVQSVNRAHPEAGEASLVASSTHPQIAPRAVAKPDGGFWVVWIEEAEVSGSGTVWARPFDASGQPGGPAEAVSPPGALTPASDALAAAPAPSGGLLVAWSGFGPGSRGEAAVYLQRIGAGERSAPVRVSEEKPGPRDSDIEVGLAVNGRGEVAVAWIRKGNLQKAWARVFSSSLEALGPEARLGPDGNDPELAPAVAASGSGFVAFWLEPAGSRGDLSKLVARSFGAQGPAGKPVTVAEGLSISRSPEARSRNGAATVYGLRSTGGSGNGFEWTGCRVGGLP